MTHNLKYFPWLVMTLFACFLFIITAEYLSFEPDINFLQVKQDVVFDSVWRPTFYLHVVSGMAVILIGPFQFLKNLRNKHLNLHRALGKIYAYGILVVAAPTGLIMAFYAEGGLWSTVSFLIMSALWFFTTIMAIVTVKKKDIIGHKKWMYRSYALSFAAVTLRLLVPLMSTPAIAKHLGNSPEEMTYIIIVSTAWLSWIINLIFVEFLILYTFRSKRSITN